MTDTVKKVVQQYGVLVMLVLPTDVPVGSKVEWGVLSGGMPTCNASSSCRVLFGAGAWQLSSRQCPHHAVFCALVV